MKRRDPTIIVKLTDDEIRRELAEFEERYGMPSSEFLLRYNSGELGDALDFIEWSGLLRIASKVGVYVAAGPRLAAMPDLLAHFDDVTAILRSSGAEEASVAERYIRERDGQYDLLRLTLVYGDGSELYVRLEADCSDRPIWPDYAFVYRTPTGRDGFRYDNAPHFPGLPNFPHHLHLSPGEVLPIGPPAIRDVARAVLWHLNHPGRAWRAEAE